MARWFITNIQLLLFPPHYTFTYTRSNRLCFFTFTIGTRLAMRKYMYITMCVIYDNLEAHKYRYGKENARHGLITEPTFSASTASLRGCIMVKAPNSRRSPIDSAIFDVKVNEVNEDRLSKVRRGASDSKQSYIFVFKPFLSPSLYIYCIYLSLSLSIHLSIYLLNLTSSRLLFDCLLYLLRLLDPSVLYPPSIPVRFHRVP